MLGIYIVAKVKHLPSQKWSGWPEIFHSARDAAWGLFLILIILGGIYGGVFTPTEAAAEAASYEFIVNNFVYRAVNDRFIVLFEPNFKRNFIHIRDIANVFLFA